MTCHKERIFSAFGQRATANMLPKGELFISSDFLNHYCPEQKGAYITQLRSAAQTLGLSLLGVDLDEQNICHLLQRRSFRQLDQLFLVGSVAGPVSRMIKRLGFLKTMTSIKNNPRYFSDLNRLILEDIKRKSILARSNGFCAVAVADDIAGQNGPLFSPGDFVDRILPSYTQIAQILKSIGLLAFFHSDGNTSAIIKFLIEAGYDCIHPVDAQAGMDLYEMKKTFGERVSFMGHVDIIAWNIERICREITRAEDEFKAGGLVLGSSCGLSCSVAGKALTALYPFIKK